MNQGKLEVVKQEMARVNIDILGISEIKWIRMGKFNSGDHYATGYNSRNTEEMEPKQKQHPVVDVTGNGSKVQCCKEQYCIGILDPRIKANWKWSNRRWQE